jgi:hypothetical protein
VIARFLAWLDARRAARIDALAQAALDAYGCADYSRARRLIGRIRVLQRRSRCSRNCKQGRTCSCSDFQPT